MIANISEEEYILVVMSIKILLIVNAVCFFLLGLAFILVPGQLSSSSGVLPAMGEVYARALGGMFMGMGLISWFAKSEKADSRLLLGVLLGNMVAHLLQSGGDFYAMHHGLLNSSGWISVGIHGVFGLWFLIVLLRVRK